jgi:hypothetical protein
MSVNTAALPSTRPSHRTSVLTLLAGLLFVVVPAVVELVTYDAFVLMGVALLLLVAALPGLHRLQAGRDGRLGRWGLRMTVAGLLAMVVLVLGGDVLDAALSGTAQSVAEGLWAIVAGLAAVSALGGVVAFSVGMTRARVLAPAGIWAFLGGMTVGLVSESFEQSLDGTVPWLADVLPPLGYIAAGAGLVVLGLSARRVEG